jgi:ribosomal-protein-alanine N-acetyltransferase
MDGGSGARQADVTLRGMQPDDVPRVAALERDLFRVSAWTPAMLAEELNAWGRWYIVAQTAQGLVVGYAGLWFDGDVSQVMTIGVDQSFQGCGIGAVLIDALIGRSRQLGAQSVFLEVAVNNDAAISLYHSRGFQQVSIRKRYYQPENLDASVMRLALDTPDTTAANSGTLKT